MDDASVGSAKASRVEPMAPWVRSRPPRLGPASAMVLLVVRLAQPLQRRAEPFGLSSLGVVVGAGFLDRLGLRAFGEVRIGETPGEAVAFLLGGGRRPREARLFRLHVDCALQWHNEF